MPMNRADYPPDWEEIRARILIRAGNNCEGSPKYPDCAQRMASRIRSQVQKWC